MSKRIKINTSKTIDCRYSESVKIHEVKDRYIRYENALKLAKDLKMQRNERISVIVSGSFVFGDFIEAFILENKIKVKKMTLSTLSYNENNIDSLKNMLENEYVDELNIIVSDYFFGHERTNLISYAYDILDSKKNTFQLAIERTHCKVYIFETYNDSYFVIHGSVNLRSSGNFEQFVIEENKKQYDFYNQFFSEILERNKTINKSLKFNKSWQADQKIYQRLIEKEQDKASRPKQNKEELQLKDGIQEWQRHFDEFDF